MQDAIYFVSYELLSYSQHREPKIVAKSWKILKATEPSSVSRGEIMIDQMVNTIKFENNIPDTIVNIVSISKIG